MSVEEDKQFAVIKNSNYWQYCGTLIFIYVLYNEAIRNTVYATSND